MLRRRTLSQPTDKADDPAGVPDSSFVLRRITPEWYVPDGQGGHKASSQAFQDLHGAMSVGLSVVLDEMELPHSTPVEAFPGYGLLRFSAAFIRELQQGIVRSASEAEPWHGDVHGKKTGSVRNRLSKAGTDWVRRPHGPDMPGQS